MVIGLEGAGKDHVVDEQMEHWPVDEYVERLVADVEDFLKYQHPELKLY